MSPKLFHPHFVIRIFLSAIRHPPPYGPHFTETLKYTTSKIHKNYIRDPSGIFSIISRVGLSMISLKSSLSLKIRWCIIETSSGLRQSSEILGKCSGTFVWPSEQFWKIFGDLRKVVVEIFGKSSKTPSSACLYNKKNITRRLEDMNFIFSWQNQSFTHSLRSFVKYCFATRK